MSIPDKVMKLKDGKILYDDLRERVGSLKSAINDKADVIVRTASGDIASFADGANGMPIKSMTVQIEPVQDLHGYDNPWPGGGGSNLAGVATVTNVHGLTANVATDGVITINGTATAASYIQGVFNCPDASAQYTWALFNTAVSGGVEISVRTSSDASAGGWGVVNSANKTLTFTPSAEPAKWQIYVANGTALSNFVIKPMIVSGSTAPASFSPYSNICPITGHTAATVTRTGRNLLNKAAGVPYDNPRFIKFGVNQYTDTVPNKTIKLSAGTYTFSTSGANSTNWESFAVFDESNARVVISYNAASHTFTLAKTGFYYITLAVTAKNFTTWDNYNLQLELGSTASTYTPYVGQTYSISWQTAAGTVYGGTLDPVTGVVRVERGEVDAGTLTWANNVTGIFSAQLAGMTTANAQKVICSIYGYGVTQFNWNNANSYADKTINTASNNYIYIKDTSYADAASFKTAMSGVQLVYELATPTEITLDPVTLTTLLGSNRIWSDAGAVSVDYCADTKTYVDNASPEAPVQDVQVNGVSALNNGVANVPLAGNNSTGVVKVIAGSGLWMNGSNLLISKGSDSEVKSGSNNYASIVPGNQHAAAFYGLAKAAGSDEKNSSLPVGQYTESAKSAIHEMLNGSVSVSGTTPSITALPGVRYICGEVATLSITPPASGCIDVVFESGSTPTVLTINGTVKWANGFDPSSLDADTTYEINILDGLGVAGAWT